MLCAVLALAFMTAPAGAQDINSANFMLPHCKAETDPFWRGVCYGSVAALVYVGPALADDLRFCAPRGATRRQMVRVVVAHIEAQPSRMHEDFRWLALEAMREAWPCSSTNERN